MYDREFIVFFYASVFAKPGANPHPRHQSIFTSMKRCIILLIISVSWFTGNHATAQDKVLPVRYLKFDPLTINEGLSQGMVNAILQDQYGFMWFGTKDGLNRYDGYNFIVYRHDAADPSSISDNYVTQIFEDSQHRLWIGTAGQGVDLFDRRTEKFKHFRRVAGDNKTLTDDRIIRIQEDKEGRIWIGTVNGISRITIENINGADQFSVKQIHLDTLEIFKRQPGFALDETFSSNMFIDSKGVVWISTSGRLLNIITSDKDDKITELDVNKYVAYTNHDKGLEFFAQDFIEDTVRHKLYMLMEFSVAIIDQQTGKLTVVPDQRFHTGIYGARNCTDKKGNLWLAESEWLERTDRYMNRTRILATDDGLNVMLRSVKCIYTDHSANVWIGTKGYGLMKHSPQTELFHHTGNESISWMSVAKDNKVIICKSDHNIDIFDPSSASFTEKVPGKSMMNKFDTPQYSIIETAVQDNDGIYWIGKGSLIRYDADKNLMTSVTLPDQITFPVFKDHKGTIWFGRENSFSSIDLKSLKIHNYTYPFKSSRVPYQFVEAVHEDASGIFWLGTVNGLVKFNPADSNWKVFRNDPKDSTSISFNLIFSLCPDPLQPEKYLWIGTNGGGLNRFDKTNGKAVRYTSKNGLPNDVIYGILSDDNNNLWMSTNKGLSCYNIKNNTFRNFDKRNGLQNNEFNRYACTKNDDGLLFFGGVNGFNYFNPAELTDHPVAPEVMITDLKLRNKSIDLSEPNCPLKQPAYLTDEAEFQYRDNMITFEFAAMDYSASSGNRFQYRLEGFDKQWISSGTTHSATYTNLDPGEYVFHVRASNNDRHWTLQDKSMIIRILPPWYMTIWFRILVCIAVAVFIYMLYRSRLKHALALHEVRNRLARDLHDEIGSNLSSISIFSDVAVQKSNGNAEMTHLLGKINEFTQTSMESISDIVWMINPHHEHFRDIISRMREMAAELFEVKGYELDLQFDEQLNDVRISMDDKRNLYLLYKEALNNAAKYAEGTKLSIILKFDAPDVILEISDNGKGFDVRSIRYGNGLHNMRQRAAMLKGTVYTESEPGEGTTIKLRFPI